MRKHLFLFVLSLFAANTLFAQDDDLPPPSSRPKNGSQNQAAQDSANSNTQFQGFTKRKKIDLSKFIIEPDFNFGIGSGYITSYVPANYNGSTYIDLGLSPCVGYEVYKNLFVGGSVTYLYTGYRNVPLQDPITGGAFYTNLNWHTFGGGPMVQYNIWKGFFARAHLEILYRIMDDPDGTVTPTLNVQTNTYTISVPKIDITIPDLLLGVGYNLLRSKNFFFPIMVSYNVLYPTYGSNEQAYSVYQHGWVVQLGFVDIW